MQQSKDSILIIDMIVPDVEPRYSKLKKKVRAGLKDSHTLYEETDLISLVAEAISLQRDQSIMREMYELYILLNRMQKGLMVSINWLST